MKNFFLSAALFLASTHLNAGNVILFVGDGMGQAYVTAARVYSKGASGSLNMDKFPYTAYSRTYSTDRIVTDSAAGATAFATGENTKVGRVSVASDGKKKLESLAEIAKAKGMAVGIVSTTRITHATPAAFYAHVDHRDKEDEIAKAMLASDFDLFLGGGLRHFNEKKLSKRKKTDFVQTSKELAALDPAAEKKVIGLFSSSHLTYMSQKKEDSTEPTLSEMTAFAIRKLSQNKKGYFLMVEGGRIDHGGHDTVAKDALDETVEFDNSVGKALSLATADDTLILVTADHETGGLAINGYPAIGEDILGKTLHEGATYPVLTFATGKNAGYNKKWASHTGVDVPVYAWGLDAEKVRGTVKNTKLFTWMLAVLNNNNSN